ncbi:hypothetical protein D7D26_02850 [Pyramidobacter sp. CG50-2]|nr:hypothetical protein D7D26_02850 [Pyramidobacter sp. CG50-2]
MNLLELVPGVSAILDKVITTPGELEKIKMEMRKIDMSEVTARLNVQKAWLGNKSPYVAGAIPTVIWMCCAVIAFNHIAAPLLSWLFSTVGWLVAPVRRLDAARARDPDAGTARLLRAGHADDRAGVVRQEGLRRHGHRHQVGQKPRQAGGAAKRETAPDGRRGGPALRGAVSEIWRWRPASGSLTGGSACWAPKITSGRRSPTSSPRRRARG